MDLPHQAAAWEEEQPPAGGAARPWEQINLSSHLESGPVPRCVPVCWPLHMPKLDLVGGVRAPDLHGELHLQELVGFLPVDLNVIAEGHGQRGLAGRDRAHPPPAHSSQLPTRPKNCTTALEPENG